MAEERMLNDEILLGLIKANSGGGGGGTTDYEDLDNKPQIGGVTLSGNKSLSDLGAQEKLTAGMYININSGTISVKRDVSEDVDEVMTLTHDTSGGTNKVNAVLTVGGETIDSETFTTSGGTFHDLVQISFNGQAVRFKFKYLAASKTQSAGYENYIYNEYTDTFVETIGEESKLIIKSEMDSALSGKQDTLTFDDAPTDGSSNPVKSNGIYDALALKQDATDNSLQTTDKTVVGAINEHEGDISQLKSGLTNLDNEVNGDATTYPYADVITIPDAIPANVADCSVKIEPVQDLHGQSAPYVGGAGKNLLPMTVDGIKAANTSGTWSGNNYTLNGVSFSVNTDDSNNVISIKVTGNLNAASSSLNIATMQAQSDPVIMNGCPSGGGSSTYRLNWAGNGNDNGNGVTIQTPVTGNVMIAIYSLTTGDELTFYPMIRLSTETDAAFAPYTNICPITGHTESVVTRTGKNLIDDSNLGHGIRNNETGEIESQSNTATSITIPISIKGNTNYCISYNGLAKTLRCYYYNANMDYIGTELTNNGVFTTPSNCAYYAFQDGSESGATDKWQLELGSSATDYEPYAGKTYTIAIGDTIYGGNVDFNTGVMTVTHAIVDMGTLTWGIPSSGNKFFRAVPTGMDTTYSPTTSNGHFLCSHYDYAAVGTTNWDNGICIADQYVRVRDDAYAEATVEEFKTAMDGVQLVYPLATPFTVQLTPQQIQLLKGTNTLTASTGQISVTANSVSGSIGEVQTQANSTDAALTELTAEIAEQLPTAPTTDGAYVLTVTVADGTPTYSWESAT